LFDIDNPSPRDELHVEYGDGNGSFRTNQVFKTGSGPIALIAGDFNHDGHVDLVSANTPIIGVSGPSTLSVFLGDGKGNFSRTDIDLTFEPFGLIAADFNKDGNLDLAVAGSNQTFLFLGNGDGTFRSGVTLNLAGYMSVGDFNEDGNVDLVTNAGGASIYFGEGDGTFSPPQPLSAGTPQNVIAADLDGDGHLDLVLPVANFPSATLCIAWGDGTGKFTQQSVPMPNPADITIAVADMDLDGRKDIVFAASGILYQTASRTFTLDGTVTDFGVFITIDDLNDDGMPDVIGYEDGNVRAYLGRGPNGLLHRQVTPLTLMGKAVAAGDFNGDGKLDIAVATASAVTILIGDGTGAFSQGVTFGNFSDKIWGIAAANFAGDTTPYIAVGADDLVIYQGDGKGNFTEFFTVQQVAPGDSGAVGKIVVKDMNGDGKLDLVLAGAGPNVVVLLGDGAGHFALASQIGLPVTSATVGDFNEDGEPDLALSQLTTNAGLIWPYLGDGAGNFTAGTSVPGGSSPLYIDTADFDHDGHLDIVIADFLYGSLLTMPTTSLVLFGDGHGNFPRNLVLNAGNQTNQAAAVDVNADGWADIVLMNDGSDDFDVFLNDQTGTFQVPYSFGVGVSPSSFQIADVDGDGRPDLITVTFNGVEVVLNRTTK
jgi:FG-GAP-like repeat